MRTKNFTPSTDEMLEEIAKTAATFEARISDLETAANRGTRDKRALALATTRANALDLKALSKLPAGQVFQALTELRHGEAAVDVLTDIGRFAKAIALSARGGRIAAEYADLADDLVATSGWSDRGKAYDTTTSGTAGYMVPARWLPELDTLRQIYGRLAAKCRVVPVAPGQLLHVGGIGAATATWRPTQGDDITVTEPVATDVELRPCLLGGIATMANEILEIPDFAFGSIWADAVVRAISKAEEYGLIQGDDSAGAYPSDGLLVAANVQDQGNIASATVADLLTFLARCEEDDDEALAPGAVLLVDPTDWLALHADVAASGGWNPLAGGRLLDRYEIIDSPAMTLVNRYAALVDPSHVWIARTPGLRIDADPFSLFGKNQSRMRVLSFVDYGFPRPARQHKTTVAAT